LLLLAIAPPLFYHKAPSPKLLTRAFPSLNSKALNPNLLLGGCGDEDEEIQTKFFLAPNKVKQNPKMQTKFFHQF
jgi:hypothetical protein